MSSITMFRYIDVRATKINMFCEWCQKREAVYDLLSKVDGSVVYYLCQECAYDADKIEQAHVEARYRDWD